MPGSCLLLRSCMAAGMSGVAGIGLAASAGFGEPELTCPCRPGQAPAGRRIPPPGFSQIQFEKSSGGFGGLFQESPGVSPPPCKSARKGWNRARAPGYGNNNSFRKVLGGFGGLFQESPGVSPYLPVSPPYPPRAPCKKEGTAHEGRFRGMITRRSDRSARCPVPGSSGRRHTG